MFRKLTAKRNGETTQETAFFYNQSVTSGEVVLYRVFWGAKFLSIRTAMPFWVDAIGSFRLARYPQFLHTFPDDPILRFRPPRVVADASLNPIRCPFA